MSDQNTTFASREGSRRTRETRLVSVVLFFRSVRTLIVAHSFLTSICYYLLAPSLRHYAIDRKLFAPNYNFPAFVSKTRSIFRHDEIPQKHPYKPKSLVSEKSMRHHGVFLTSFFNHCVSVQYALQTVPKTLGSRKLIKENQSITALECTPLKPHVQDVTSRPRSTASQNFVIGITFIHDALLKHNE